MQFKEFKFFPQDSNNMFWQLDKDGKLLLNANTYELIHSPAGWEEMTIENNRNDKYFGFDRSISGSLAFVKDGAKIIKAILNQFGEEADFFLSIAQREFNYKPGISYGHPYKYRYRGQGNFGTYKHVGPKVTIDLAEEGLAKYIKANESTQYEIDMSVGFPVKMDGVPLHNKYRYTLLEIEERRPPSLGVYTVPLQLDVQEGDSYGVIALDESGGIKTGAFSTDPSTSPYYEESDNFFYRNVGSVPVTLEVYGNYDFTKQTNSMIYNFWFEQAGGVKHKITSFGGTGTDQSIPFSYTITLQPNEKLFLFDNFSSFDSITYKETTNIFIKIITRRPATYVLHLRPQYIFDQLINMVTEGKYKAASSKLLDDYKTIAFTCADAIREVKDSNGNIQQLMKISLWEYFQFWDYNFNCGLTERNGEVLLERKEDLIDKTQIIKLGAPATTPSFEIDSKPSFNEVEYGYPDISSAIGTLNGREEFNCRAWRSIGMVMNPKKLSRISPVRTSCYEQEKHRTDFILKDTTSTNKDNFVYANHIEANPEAGFTHYLLDRSINTSITGGLLEPLNVWNVFLRPEAMFERNGSFYRSSFYKCDHLVLKFISGDRNTKVQFNGQSESIDRTIGSLAAPYIVPYWQVADFPVADNLMSNIDINPLQVFETTLNGVAFLWLGKKITSGSTTKKLQNYQLISLGSNDFSSLVNFEG